MPNLPFQFITVIADILIFIFVGYYILRLHSKEKELEKLRSQIDSEYHKIVDNALSKERKILDDATHEADQIITGAHYINRNSTERVEQTLQQLVAELQKGTVTSAQNFMNSYSNSLQQLTSSSLTNFQNVAKSMELDIDKQSKDFRNSLLPALEKELVDYKQLKMKEAEQKITLIIQKVSQDMVHKSLSPEDHHALLVESLEKAKKEGVFN